MASGKVRILLGLLSGFLVVGCSSVVEPVILSGISSDPSLQEQFEIKVEPLTFKIAQELNTQTFQRFVSRPGAAFSADVLPESSILKNQFPPNSEKTPYKLGIGDTVQLIQSVDETPDMGSIEEVVDLSVTVGERGGKATNSTPIPSTSQKSSQSVVFSTTGRVSTDGSLLLIGIGKILAKGREIFEIRDEIRSIFIRLGRAPNFQLEIRDFNSQKAYITAESAIGSTGASSFVSEITDQGLTLRQLLATAGIGFDERFLITVKLQRDGKTYSFSLADLFSDQAPELYLRDKDHIFIQSLKYVDGKVFLVGGVTPTMISITPENRQTLAEVLFARNGPMEIKTAKRSAVYLLRGVNPVKAYHLDAQNPARILVADAIELRPNDIVFVAEQSINTFNRTLETILPLRLFSRDVRDNQVP